MKKETKITVIVALVLVIITGAASAVYFLNDNSKQNVSDIGSEANLEVSDTEKKYAKTITVLVNMEGEETKTFTIDTDAEFLLDALNEIHLVEGNKSTYGLYITAVDGVTADEDKKEWWKVTKNGEMTSTAVDDTPIEDGETFELTLSTY